jgi:hypothetical protein
MTCRFMVQVTARQYPARTSSRAWRRHYLGHQLFAFPTLLLARRSCGLPFPSGFSESQTAGIITAGTEAAQ